MVKNKIYKYFSIEIFKSFITILFAFSIVAWTVRSVNFLDLIVDSGHSLRSYFLYSFLNISGIITKFIPLSFLLALVVSIYKFNNKNELMIVWTTGLSKLRLANLFLFLSIVITIIHLIFSSLITPYTLNKSRSTLTNDELGNFSINMRENTFTDTFAGITFFVEKKINDRFYNIFISDEENKFQNIISTKENNNNLIILAKEGFINQKKLVLFNGRIQSISGDNELDEIVFKKTELVLSNFDSRTTKVPKVQEISTNYLMRCNNSENLILLKDNYHCPENNLRKETVARRLGLPLYIPLVSIICSFLLRSRGKNSDSFFKRYFIFFISFITLLSAELLLRFAGFSELNTLLYFLIPIIGLPLLYYMLKINLEKQES